MCTLVVELYVVFFSPHNTPLGNTVILKIYVDCVDALYDNPSGKKMINSGVLRYANSKLSQHEDLHLLLY